MFINRKFQGGKLYYTVLKSWEFELWLVIGGVNRDFCAALDSLGKYELHAYHVVWFLYLFLVSTLEPWVENGGVAN